MNSDNQNERERLKEEYKEHYRKIREIKERLAGTRKKRTITDALNNMDPSALMDTFDEFLVKVKSKVAQVEARLDIAMDDLASAGKDVEAEQQRDEEFQKAQAKETLRQAKIEMGLLYSEIEDQADAMKVEKTIGSKEKTAGEGTSGDPEKESPQRQQKQHGKR